MQRQNEIYPEKCPECGSEDIIVRDGGFCAECITCECLMYFSAGKLEWAIGNSVNALRNVLINDEL